MKPNRITNVSVIYFLCCFALNTFFSFFEKEREENPNNMANILDIVDDAALYYDDNNDDPPTVGIGFSDPDSNTLLFQSYGGIGVILNSTTSQRIRTIDIKGLRVLIMSYHKIVYVTSHTNTVVIEDIILTDNTTAGNNVNKCMLTVPPWISCGCISSTILAVSCESEKCNNVIVYDYTLQTQLAILPQPRRVIALAISPDNVLLAAADKTGVVTLWDITTRKVRENLICPILQHDRARIHYRNRWPDPAEPRLTFSRDGKRLSIHSLFGVNVWSFAGEGIELSE